MTPPVMTAAQLRALGVKVHLPAPTPKGMNKTEARYQEMLEERRVLGTIAHHAYQLLTVRLGDDLRYTPDFVVILPDGVIELHEVKGGFVRDDARVKLLATAAQLPFVCKLAQFTKSDGWRITTIAR